MCIQNKFKIISNIHRWAVSNKKTTEVPTLACIVCINSHIIIPYGQENKMEILKENDLVLFLAL